MRSYISNNKDIVLTRIFEDDSVEAMARFLQAITKKTDYKMLDELLIRSDQSSQIRAYLLNLTNNIDSQSKSVENELKKDPFSVTEVKKNWLYKADENGFIVITAYKGAEIQVVIPDRVGKTKVKRIGEYAFSAKRNRATPEQQRSVNQIRSIHVPDGIESLGSGLCQWSMMLTDVFLPGSIKEIGESAFQTYRGLKSIIIHAPAGSYAEQYAKENDIPFVAE